jgi:hypothetical protein
VLELLYIQMNVEDEFEGILVIVDDGTRCVTP